MRGCYYRVTTGSIFGRGVGCKREGGFLVVVDVIFVVVAVAAAVAAVVAAVEHPEAEQQQE